MTADLEARHYDLLAAETRDGRLSDADADEFNKIQGIRAAEENPSPDVLAVRRKRREQWLRLIAKMKG